MRTLLTLLIAGAALSGCVVAPIEPVGGVYAAPPSVVVVPRHRHYHGHPHRWHRHWHHRRR